MYELCNYVCSYRYRHIDRHVHTYICQYNKLWSQLRSSLTLVNSIWASWQKGLVRRELEKNKERNFLMFRKVWTAALKEVGRHKFKSSCFPSCHQISGSCSCQANTCGLTLGMKQGKSEIKTYFGTQNKYKTELLRYSNRGGERSLFLNIAI